VMAGMLIAAPAPATVRVAAEPCPCDVPICRPGCRQTL
jgi:hypothetical protein